MSVWHKITLIHILQNFHLVSIWPKFNIQDSKSTVPQRKLLNICITFLKYT